MDEQSALRTILSLDAERLGAPESVIDNVWPNKPRSWLGIPAIAAYCKLLSRHSDRVAISLLSKFNTKDRPDSLPFLCATVFHHNSRWGVVAHVPELEVYCVFQPHGCFLHVIPGSSTDERAFVKAVGEVRV